jgi:hypothetical protein
MKKNFLTAVYVVVCLAAMAIAAAAPIPWTGSGGGTWRTLSSTVVALP